MWERACLNVGFLERSCLYFVHTGSLIVIVLLAEATGTWKKKNLTKTEQKNNLQFACQWIFVPCSSGCSVQSWFSRICEAMLVLTYTRTLGKQHSGAGTEGFLVLRVAGSGCLSLPIRRLHACFPAKLC